MEIRITETKDSLKIEKWAKKEMILRTFIFWFTYIILLYCFCNKITNISEAWPYLIFFPLPFVFMFFLTFIVKYKYERLEYRKGKMYVDTSLFYRVNKKGHYSFFLRDIKKMGLNNILSIFDRTAGRNPRYQFSIYFEFKNGYITPKGHIRNVWFGMNISIKEAEEVIQKIESFIEKQKKKGKTAEQQKQNYEIWRNLSKEQRYERVLEQIVEEGLVFFQQEEKRFMIDYNREEQGMPYYKFYHGYILKQEYQDYILEVGNNGIDSKEVNITEFKRDIYQTIYEYSQRSKKN